MKTIKERSGPPPLETQPEEIKGINTRINVNRIKETLLTIKTALYPELILVSTELLVNVKHLA
jgi:hypothetical protein